MVKICLFIGVTSLFLNTIGVIMKIEQLLFSGIAINLFIIGCYYIKKITAKPKKLFRAHL